MHPVPRLLGLLREEERRPTSHDLRMNVFRVEERHLCSHLVTSGAEFNVVYFRSLVFYAVSKGMSDVHGTENRKIRQKIKSLRWTSRFLAK